ncbi:MAG TPA: hypothetical protein VNA14_13400 [Mycobacteriales bacterium]|nr:hypothetical protein [Mycobacteriales bacterium]
MSAAPWARAVRLGLVVATAVTTATATASVAAPCRTQPRNVETLRVDVRPGAAVRGRVFVVEVRVVREASSAPVEGADVSTRLRTSDGPRFAGGTTDERGQVTLQIGLDAGLRSGSAVLATDAWLEATPGHWCVPAVNERGYAETSVEVR